MGKVDEYRIILRTLDDWDPYLLQESGLPGRRGNLELAYAVAEEGNSAQFERWLAYDAGQAPTNTPEEFLAFCGVLGAGKLLSQGHLEYLEVLRRHASDPRWRTREAVAQGLQYLGDEDMPALLAEMAQWSNGNPLEQRAAAAALCEPRLLHDPEQVAQVLQILDRITASILDTEDRRSEDFQVLRKGLGYCWSVTVVANPAEGKPAIEKWFASDDRDVRWIMKQNLRKKRLERMDADWIAGWKFELGM